MLARIRELTGLRHSFAFETTLASRTFPPHLRDAREQGYRVHLFFLTLPDAGLAVARVSQRVSAGGHDMPENEVRRRYTGGRDNFFGLYRPLADEWYVVDNSDYHSPRAIASGRGTSVLRVFRQAEWLHFSGAVNEH